MSLKAVSPTPHKINLTMRMLRAGLVTALCMACACWVQAAEPSATVEHARIRWLPGDLPLAGYFDLTNTGKHAITLTGASSAAFGDVMMHQTINSNRQARMVAAHDLKVLPGHTLHFAPEGYHLMLMGQTRPLAVGDVVPISLTFSGGRSIQVKFTVRGADMQ